MPEGLEPRLSENDQPKDSGALNLVSPNMQRQEPVKGILAAIATVQKEILSMNKTKKIMVFATGASIILLAGFWPTGKSDILGGTMSVRCGVLHWNQKITFEGITLTCNGVESDGIENRNDYWIEVRFRDKDNQEIYDVVAPRSSIDIEDNSYLSARVEINVTKIDPANPIRHSINPNYGDNTGQKIWGHWFSVMERDNQQYIQVSKQSMFTFSGSSHAIEVIYNGRIHDVNTSNHNGADGGYLIPIESKQEISSNTPINIGLQITDLKYAK
jgi:hypothetical protein